LFQNILSLSDDLRPRLAPAWVEGIGGEEEAAGEVCPDGEKNDQMGMQIFRLQGKK